MSTERVLLKISHRFCNSEHDYTEIDITDWFGDSNSIEDFEEENQDELLGQAIESARLEYWIEKK